MPGESFVRVSDGGTTFAGPDAVELFVAGAVQSALRMYAGSGMVTTRGAGVKFLLGRAARYLPPGKKFAATRKGAAAAAEAIEVWKNNLASAMPIIDSRPGAG